MPDQYSIKPVIVSLLCAGLLVAMTVEGTESDASGYVNDPFTRLGIITPYTLPEAWPVHLDRNPHDRSPGNAGARLVVLGTGMSLPNPYRFGPAYAVVAGDQPYLVDAGEGIWRALAKAALIHGDEINMALAPEKLNYLFVTHLHEDHTVGIPSLVLNPFKLNIPAPKAIYGPAGIGAMVEHILAAWKIDIAAELSDGYDPIGAQATGYDLEVAQQGLVYQDDNVKVEASRTIHGPLKDTFAYRFTTQNRIITFTRDGGPYHENIVKAALNADLLVTEAVTEKISVMLPGAALRSKIRKSRSSGTTFHRPYWPGLLPRQTCRPSCSAMNRITWRQKILQGRGSEMRLSKQALREPFTRPCMETSIRAPLKIRGAHNFLE